jgi:hypothetical protein
VLAFFSRIPRCVVGLEACATAHYWARELGALGHEVRLMPAQYVKAYIKRNKHDAADAEAICEAVQRPTMRFVNGRATGYGAGRGLFQRRLADFAAEIAAGRVVVIEIAGAVGGTWFGHERGLARLQPGHDAFTLCIGHREGELFVADVVRGTRPPFDPHEVTKDLAALCREYKITQVRGDRYSAEWVTTAFRDAGVNYKPAEKNKSELYIEALPLFTRGAVSIPDLPPLLRELRLLERAVHRGGKDTVDHPRNGSDDFANALCGCAALAKSGSYISWLFDDRCWDDGPPPDDPKVVEERRRKLYELLVRGEKIPF